MIRHVIASIVVTATVAQAEPDPMLENLDLEGEDVVLTRSTRVVGGIDAELGAYPFYSALMTVEGEKVKGLCGSAIIDPNWLLTAAHCVQGSTKSGRAGPIKNARNLRARPGGLDLRDMPSFKVKRVIPYPKYAKPFAIYHDIALIELAEPLDAPSVSLPEESFNPQKGVPVRIVGYGNTSYNGDISLKLKEAATRLVSRRECSSVSRITPRAGPIDRTRICADVQGDTGIVDSCQGDSGGPLLSIGPDGRWRAIGVVSYGHKCAVPGFHGVYTNVVNYLPWIRHVMEGGNPAITEPPKPVTPPPPPPPVGEAPAAAPTAVQQLFDLVDYGGVTIETAGTSDVQAGEQLAFRISSRLAGDLYVFDIGSSGDTRQLFPNDRTRQGRVKAAISAAKPRPVPGRRDGFRLRAPDGSAQRWVVAMVVTKKPDLREVAATRGLSMIEEPGEYLREILASVAEPCQKKEIDCAFGALQLTVTQ
ncbi:MAG: trypsin-like serine protease [Pseudomonadota bacterium]